MNDWKKKIFSPVGMAYFGIACMVVLGLLFKAPSKIEQWRYRTTVEVITPEGIKTGSAVRKVMIDTRSWDDISVTGEAVEVDLGARGTLFALMYNGENVDYAWQVTLDFSGDTPGKILLTGKEAPLFVRFRDINDPTTVEVVKDLESAFGKGVSLESVTMEFTKDPVTWTGIQDRLPWLYCPPQFPSPGNVRFRLYNRLRPEYFVNTRELYELTTRPVIDQKICGPILERFKAADMVNSTSPIKECPAADKNCNPYDTPENRMFFTKKPESSAPANP